MKRILIAVSCLLAITSCKLSSTNQHNEENKELNALFDKYFDERMQLFPLEATQNGDNRFNDQMFIDFTDGYRDTLSKFFNRYLTYVTKFDREQLNDNDRISYDIFKREMEISMEGMTMHDNYTPFQQFWGLPLSLGQLGSGDGNQPFKTVADYDNWLKRASVFSAWTDSAIVYFRKGMAMNYVLPAVLVKKMIPQMQAMLSADTAKNLFYEPIHKMPASFADTDKKRLSQAYAQLVTQTIVPSYQKLAVFLQNEYLPKARTTTGINAVPTGDKQYDYLTRFWTTTNKKGQDIYELGLSEVKRIRAIMDSVKNAVGYQGDLQAFFNYMRSDKQFMPYKTPEEVLDAFRKIQATIDPNLKKMFTKTPITKFEIRQTEAFRAASASAEYNQGSPDGTRPGIFYVPILDATKFNITSGMESLFLHEAIPGHHYQISLQQENTRLPKFRRFSSYGAYVEGWALYCESLGKELGLYTNPYQYMGALGDEMHRAVRLVVDEAMHTGKMTREEAIKYMMDNEAINEEGAVAEIERYMAIPAQALSYKIGALKIKELRERYQQQLGSKFSLAAYHDELLKDGSMPLDVLERKMDDWAKKQQ